MKIWCFIVALFLAIFTSPHAHAVDLESIKINYKDYFASSRDPLLVSSHPKESVNLALNLNLGAGFFWDNWVLSETDPGGYRVIAWNFKLGVKIIPSLDIQYEHKSTHLIDQKYQGMCNNQYCDFPVEDSIGLVWTIYQGASRKPAFSP